MKFSDNVIGRIAQIVQEGMLLGIDVVDLMRQIEVEPAHSIDGSQELELTAEYVRGVREQHEKLLAEAEARHDMRAESAKFLFDS